MLCTCTCSLHDCTGVGAHAAWPSECSTEERYNNNSNSSFFSSLSLRLDSGSNWSVTAKTRRMRLTCLCCVVWTMALFQGQISGTCVFVSLSLLFLYLQFVGLHFVVPMRMFPLGNSGRFPQGKHAATESRYPATLINYKVHAESFFVFS